MDLQSKSYQQSSEDWTTIIKPKDRLLAVDFREIWNYRDLYLLFVRRDISTAYKQTILGPLWFFINPILSMVVMVAVFGGIVGIPTDGVPATLFYLLGPAIWGYFSNCLSATSNSFVSNANIFGKVYFPRILMPLVAVTTNLVGFGVQLLIFIAFYVYYVATGTPIAPNITLLLFPVLVLLVAFMAIGFGMIISSVSTKYRDVQMFFSYIVSLWMYVTPVIYPLSMVTNPKLHLMMSLNPITPLIEAFKYACFGVGDFSWLWLGYSVLMTALLLTIGLALFNKTQKSFMDTV